jgi:nitrite reductase/ring-hydroxylating ferredoxin subunit
VSLFEVDGDVVRLAFSGSCKGCPSSAVTLELAVEDAVRAAAPEIATIEVVSPEHNSSAIIPAESLFGRVRASGQRTSSWHPVTELNDLRDGEIGGFLVAGATVVVCRVGQNLFAYHDRCGECAQSMAGAALDGAVLRCPICHAAFDVVHAGASVTGTGHLEPIPLLTHDGVLSMAVVETVSP